MKKTLVIFFIQLVAAHLIASPVNTTKAGFSMPDSLLSVTLKYRTFQNLIILPVTINDTIQVNLILDTGCRNLVLFGKRFNKFFVMNPERRVQFSGLGSGKPVTGQLSLGNKVSIDAVIGNRIPVVVVPNQNLFDASVQIDGIIGYDIFIKFEVELNLANRIITFRPALTSELSTDYEKIQIRVEDAMPIISSTIFFQGKEGQSCDLIIDTGSSLGLLVKTTDLRKYPVSHRNRLLGRGLNGYITGSNTVAERIWLGHLEMTAIPAGIIYSQFHNHASVGMEIMKNYAIVLNYCKAYVGFKRTS